MWASAELAVRTADAIVRDRGRHVLGALGNALRAAADRAGAVHVEQRDSAGGAAPARDLEDRDTRLLSSRTLLEAIDRSALALLFVGGHGPHQNGECETLVREHPAAITGTFCRPALLPTPPVVARRIDQHGLVIGT